MLADDPLKPMSYSNAVDLEPRISYRQVNQNLRGHKDIYFEQFDNKYFDAILEKKARIKEKRDMVHQERSKQSAAVSCPSKGYFT